ncbi:MAG: response regulator [Cellvibrio sp.]
MAERRNVLIIDDDRSWQAFLSVALRDDYNVIAAYDGYSGLKLAAEWLPDTILLDIEMPVKNGYEVCVALKANPLLRNIPVIVVSSKVSLEDKITGFKLGADDYVVKPCETELLSVKIERSSSLYREKKALDEKAAGAQVLAFEAMNSNADLGRALRFAERSYAIPNLDKLAEGLFQTMGEFGLDTSLMFVTPSGPKFYAQNKHELSPLEKDMFLAIHQQGRFVDFGARTFCNFTLVSLLVKNMPVSDPERYGRIKDSVPWILGVMDGKVRALDLQDIFLAHHQTIINSVQKISGNLDLAIQRLTAAAFSEQDKKDVHANILGALSLLNDVARKQTEASSNIEKNLTSTQVAGHGSGETFANDVDFF